MNQPTCKLCLSRKPNMKAHILAEGLLKLININPDKYEPNYVMLSDEYEKPKRRPTGSYDSTILCDVCDNKLGVWDEEAIRLCRREDFLQHPSKAGWIIGDVDQVKLKLFFLSYVWRASVTNLPEFAKLTLGQKHEEIIRKMLATSDSGSVDSYSVIVGRFTLPDDIKTWGKNVLLPVKNRFLKMLSIDVYLPNMYKAIVKTDSRSYDRGILPAADEILLGSKDSVFIFDMGDYRQSQEFKIMHNIILRDQKRVK